MVFGFAHFDSPAPFIAFFFEFLQNLLGPRVDFFGFSIKAVIVFSRMVAG